MIKTFAKYFTVAALLALSSTAISSDLFKQTDEITHQDMLRGTNTEQRAWWDLKHYHLSVNVDPATKSLRGTNVMTYQVLSDQKALQIELQAPMILEKVEQEGKKLKVVQDGYSYFIELEKPQTIGKEYQITMYFSGQPKEAVNPPWDGGIAWKKDDNGIDFIASACQGVGASIWWPNKDQAFDEPDNGVLLSIEVPMHLTNVSNGRLVKVEDNKERKTKTFHWQVTNPINNYGVNINIGDYVHFGEQYQGENGVLDMDYYVLRDNLAKAKKQFKDAPRTMEALEHWFGPYPFYQDSFKLVEVPYLGMEHQSSVTYGNKYQNGYLGRDRSSTGWGLKFDFIIVHESGHEWFANNITNKDVADMWIHEGFTSYSEALFVEYFYGKDAGAQYVRGTRLGIQNDSPLIGTYGVNREGSSDMYNKGSNMLHTIRQVVDNDEKWREIIRGLNKEFYHQTVTTKQVEDYMSKHSGKDLSKIFDQYLRDVRIPVLEYFVLDEVMKVRWGNSIKGFNMPIKASINGKTQWLTPTTKWSKVKIDQADVKVTLDADFYVSVMNIMGN
ncbi:MAG: M1 family metallopeptidase [Colwellia sp.]|nr:M1 family metallopeptidase [Colwellia sp.]